MSEKPLGRRVPESFEHVDKYPLRALIADPTSALAVPPDGTEKSLGLPWWWKLHIQRRNDCVGHGESAERSITNHYQRLKSYGQNITYRYSSTWLYDEALKVDEWAGEADEGTSVNAGYKVLKAQGHRRVQNGVTGPPVLAHGVDAYRWATTIDEVRAAIFGGLAVAIGVNWYENFDTPVLFNNERWIGRGALGAIRGGHCLCIYRMSDRRDAFMLMNSWGSSWAPAWLPYAVLVRLISEYGEIAVVTDR